MKTLRSLEASTVQIAEPTSDYADATLMAGGLAVAVPMDRQASLKGDVAAALRRPRGTANHQWNRWTIEELDHYG